MWSTRGGRFGEANSFLGRYYISLHTCIISRKDYSGRIQHTNGGRTEILCGNSAHKGVLRLWALLSCPTQQREHTATAAACDSLLILQPSISFQTHCELRGSTARIRHNRKRTNVETLLHSSATDDASPGIRLDPDAIKLKNELIALAAATLRGVSIYLDRRVFLACRRVRLVISGRK